MYGVLVKSSFTGPCFAMAPLLSQAAGGWSVWSSTREECTGAGGHGVPNTWHLVEMFLKPNAEELGPAMLPGRARSVAGKVVEELQRGRQAAASSEGLRNWDRSQEELKLKRPKEELKPDLPSMTVLLDGLNPEEVGCLMRTCEAAGVQELLLCGQTPGPPDVRVLKTSLKAEAFLPHRRVGPLELELWRLQKAGVQTWSLEAQAGGASRTLAMPQVTALEVPLALAVSSDYPKWERCIPVPYLSSIQCSMDVIASVAPLLHSDGPGDGLITVESVEAIFKIMKCLKYGIKKNN
ncbi:unnamed protein product [Durusdinium trenchii]|uniref:Uncharacterized protein n=1 Tax=Durusdinium trenchii TaxID=1381693 RepID=A0ABP0SXS8_9DINO